jgi:hypothetical protein
MQFFVEAVVFLMQCNLLLTKVETVIQIEFVGIDF